MEAKDDAVKSILCAAMASGDDPHCVEYRTTDDGEAICAKYDVASYDNIFSESKATGITGDDIYSTKYVITGAKIADIAASQQQGYSDFTQTDSFGNMVGKVSMSAVYSSGTNTCTITTTTTMCKNAEAVITTDTSEKCNSGGITIGGGGGCKSGGGIVNIGGRSYKKTVTQDYEGSVCTEFADPTTTVSNVKM